jgi:hypothetical protein
MAARNTGWLSESHGSKAINRYKQHQSSVLVKEEEGEEEEESNATMAVRVFSKNCYMVFKITSNYSSDLTSY